MTSKNYEFRADGCLPEHSREAFCGLHLEEVKEGFVLRGAVIDESHLLGIVSELRVLGLRLVSVRPSGQEAHAAPRSAGRSRTGTPTPRSPRRLLRRGW